MLCEFLWLFSTVCFQMWAKWEGAQTVKIRGKIGVKRAQTHRFKYCPAKIYKVGHIIGARIWIGLTDCLKVELILFKLWQGGDKVVNCPTLLTTIFVFLCLYLCICVFVYLCICIRVFVFVYLYLCNCICVFVLVHLYLYLYLAEKCFTLVGWFSEEV